MSEEMDYSVLYQPKITVYVVKKDGSKEAFNVQKASLRWGKIWLIVHSMEVHRCREASNLSGCDRQG